MSRRGRPRKTEGAVYRRSNSECWQVRYRDQKGEMIRESAGTSDRQDAERFLRDRLDARDEGRLTTVLNSKQMTFGQWADWFLERRSKPPFRSAGNHQQNLNALKFLRPVFGDTALSEITAEAIENYLADRLESGRRVYTKAGVQLRGKIKPATAHQEFRILFAHAQCSGEAEAAISQPLCGRRISGLRGQIHAQAALHDLNRAGQDRVGGAGLPQEHRRRSVRDGAEGTRRSSFR